MSLLAKLFLWAIGDARKNPVAWAIGVGIVAVVAFGGCEYSRGVAAEREHAAAAARKLQLERIHQQIELADRVADSTSRAEATAAAAEHMAIVHQATARKRHTQARSRVAITSDTTVSIDRGAPVVVPAPLVTTVRTADSLIAADSARDRAAEHHDSTQVANTQAIAEQRDLERSRADTAEHQNTTPRATSRCGLACKTVAAVGATVIAVKVVAPWIARRIHPRAPTST